LDSEKKVKRNITEIVKRTGEFLQIFIRVKNFRIYYIFIKVEILVILTNSFRKVKYIRRERPNGANVKVVSKSLCENLGEFCYKAIQKHTEE
jgi:hypothetical protein